MTQSAGLEKWRSAAEEWQRKYEALSQNHQKLMMELSHKLRTPLTSIKSFAEILSRYPDEKTEQRAEFLQIIQNEAQRMHQMIADLLDTRPDGKTASPSDANPSGAKAKSTPTVLVIDDEENLLKSISYFLDKYKFESLTAPSLAKANQVLQYANPDVIFLDIFLPDGNGYDYCAKLKSAKPKRPVILMSAKGEERNRLKAMEVKADGFIAKPFSFDEVLATLRNLTVRP
jgi:CheY-like chemotaxis protein